MKKWKSKGESGEALQRLGRNQQGRSSSPLPRSLGTPTGANTRATAHCGKQDPPWSPVRHDPVAAAWQELSAGSWERGDNTPSAAAHSALPGFCLSDKQHLCQDRGLAIGLIFDSGQSLARSENNKLTQQPRLGTEVE